MHFYLIQIICVLYPLTLVYNLSGGPNNIVTTEVLTDSGWETTQTTLPFEVYASCLGIPVSDEGNYFVVGGYGNWLSKTLMFSPSTLTWTLGPNMAMRRYGHGCGRLPTSDKSNRTSIIVAGGYSTYVKSSSEIVACFMILIQMFDQGSISTEVALALIPQLARVRILPILKFQSHFRERCY